MSERTPDKGSDPRVDPPSFDERGGGPPTSSRYVPGARYSTLFRDASSISSGVISAAVEILTALLEFTASASAAAEA